jgi:hypothetical protein
MALGNTYRKLNSPPLSDDPGISQNGHELPKLDLNASVQQSPFMDHRPFLFVIPSVPGFPTSPLSPATTYVVLPKENHMLSTEAATLYRKSGEAEGSAVPRTSLGNAEYDAQTELSFSRASVLLTREWGASVPAHSSQKAATWLISSTSAASPSK